MAEIRVSGWSDFLPGDVIKAQVPRYEGAVHGIAWVVDRPIVLPEVAGAIIRIVPTMPDAGVAGHIYERDSRGYWYRAGGDDGYAIGEISEMVAKAFAYEVIFEGFSDVPF